MPIERGFSIGWFIHWLCRISDFRSSFSYKNRSDCVTNDQVHKNYIFLVWYYPILFLMPSLINFLTLNPHVSFRSTVCRSVASITFVWTNILYPNLAKCTVRYRGIDFVQLMARDREEGVKRVKTCGGQILRNLHFYLLCRTTPKGEVEFLIHI